MSEEKNSQDTSTVSFQEFCRRLAISEATGRNWLRLGRIVSSGEDEKGPYFTETYAGQFLDRLREGNIKTLKSRRNKKFAGGCGMYESYLPEDSVNLPVIAKFVKLLGSGPLEERRLREALCECALQLLCQAAGKAYGQSGNYLRLYGKGQIDLGEYDILIRELLEGQPGRRGEINGLEEEASKDRQSEIDCWQSQDDWERFSGVSFQLEPRQDVLGMLYLSLKNFRARKAAGAYYTPARIVRQVTDGLFEREVWRLGYSGRILDPCCGTGNFLLSLSKFGMENLYGMDIDPLAVKIARINLAIACPAASVSMIRDRIREGDFLMGYGGKDYDVILGNPPWGSSFTPAQHEVYEKIFFTGKRAEAYDLFLEQSLSQVKEGGRIAFVLPEAALYVKSHLKIREILARQAQIESLSYLGNVFDKVQCPAVILQIKKTGKALDTCGMKISGKHGAFQIKTSRMVNTDYFNFHIPDDEYRILLQIEAQDSLEYLKGQAEFALGIVTGNNRKYVREEKTAQSEMVLRGCDIQKYAVREGKQYLVYEPKLFQQTAPDNFYRAKQKLLYRFIGKELIFALDDRQRLSLNSCNILIPQIPDMDIKYILAVLNSTIAQFMYDRKFRSLKVLRSYLEQIPIPTPVPALQKEIVFLAEQIQQAPNEKEWKRLYQEADRKIAAAYRLSENAYEKICRRYL